MQLKVVYSLLHIAAQIETTSIFDITWLAAHHVPEGRTSRPRHDHDSQTLPEHCVCSGF